MKLPVKTPRALEFMLVARLFNFLCSQISLLISLSAEVLYMVYWAPEYKQPTTVKVEEFLRSIAVSKAVVQKVDLGLQRLSALLVS